MVDLGAPKERVLHTRVPASLDQHVKQRARILGLSVSTVVRNVLLSTFGLVEDIVTDSANIALSITGEEVRPRAERDRKPAAGGTPIVSDVLGWQTVVLNRNAVCERCNAILRRGARAVVGVHDGAGPRAILCNRCLRNLDREGT